MMLKIFKYKEKHNMYKNLSYIMLLSIYLGGLQAPIEDGNRIGGVIVFFTFFELIQFSSFSLSPVFKYSDTWSAFKPSYTSLDTNLKMLSIKFKDFVKYSLIYSLIKLIPFVILLILLNSGYQNYIDFIVFLTVVILFSITSPAFHIINGQKNKIKIENRFESYKDIRESLNIDILDKYPNINIKYYYILTAFFPVAIGSIYIGGIILVSGLPFNSLTAVFYGTGLFGFIIIILYSYYMNMILIEDDNR